MCTDLHAPPTMPRSGGTLRALATVAMLGALLATGCETAGKPKRNDKLAALIQRLEKAQDPSLRSNCADELRGALNLRVPGAAGEAETFEFPPLRLAKIELALDSGPANWTGDDGHDGVVVTVIPKDQFGHTVKIPCAVKVELFDMQALGGFRGESILKWPTVPPAKVNESWVDSTFSGYHLKLEWETIPPPAKPVVLVVTIITRSGDAASAERTYDDGIRP